MRIVFLGLSITSSWGNGHATTYRGLVRELAARGHDVLFLERDLPWYADNRDLPRPPYGRTALYRSVDELRRGWERDVREADLVVLGSYVRDGAAIGAWLLATARGVTAFYDIDTPVTIEKLRRGDDEYLSRALVPRFDLYLSFTGGPTLAELERRHGARMARALYCSADPTLHQPVAVAERWDLGYLGTYSADRQPAVDELLLAPARRAPELRFVVGGPQYPAEIVWPASCERRAHVPPPQHARFYGAQRYTLNVTRADMRRAGWSPSVRLFEAAACGVPVISDAWPGLGELFAIGEEILVAGCAADVLHILRHTDDARREAIGLRARARVLREHTAAHRAATLIRLAREARPGIVLDRSSHGKEEPAWPECS